MCTPTHAPPQNTDLHGPSPQPSPHTPHSSPHLLHLAGVHAYATLSQYPPPPSPCPHPSHTRPHLLHLAGLPCDLSIARSVALPSVHHFCLDRVQLSQPPSRNAMQRPGNRRRQGRGASQHVQQTQTKSTRHCYCSEPAHTTKCMWKSGAASSGCPNQSAPPHAPTWHVPCAPPRQQ